MSNSKIIPNSYQTPNYYVDALMEYLTAEEWKVLSYAMRRIFGFNTRRANISISMFCDGMEVREGSHYGGTGLGTSAVKKAINGLIEAGIMMRVARNDPAVNYGDSFSLQLDENKINMRWLEERKAKKDAENKERIKKARSVRQMGGYACATERTPSVGQKVKTQETHKTHGADAPNFEMPLDWQIATEQQTLTMPDTWSSERDIALMNLIKYGADLQSLAAAFIDARHILPKGRSAYKTWGAALRHMRQNGVTAEHVIQATGKLVKAGMTVSDPYSISRTAIDIANKAPIYQTTMVY